MVEAALRRLGPLSSSRSSAADSSCIPASTSASRPGPTSAASASRPHAVRRVDRGHRLAAGLVGVTSLARRCAGLSAYAASPARPAGPRCAGRSAGSGPWHGRSPRRSAAPGARPPSTCHQAAVSPTGRASSSATARSWPLSRKLVSAASDSSACVGLVAHEAAISSWKPGRVLVAVQLVPGRQRAGLVEAEADEDRAGELDRRHRAGRDQVAVGHDELVDEVLRCRRSPSRRGSPGPGRCGGGGRGSRRPPGRTSRRRSPRPARPRRGTSGPGRARPAAPALPRCPRPAAPTWRCRPAGARRSSRPGPRSARPRCAPVRPSARPSAASPHPARAGARCDRCRRSGSRPPSRPSCPEGPGSGTES